MHTIRTRTLGLVAALAVGGTAIGAAQGTAADLRVGLNTMLAEHI